MSYSGQIHDRLLEQKDAISVVSSSANVNMLHSDWLLAEKVVKILSPFQEATKTLRDHSTSLADIFPLTKGIEIVLKHCSEVGVKSLSKELLAGLEDRFSFIKENDLYLITTVLDPRYKARIFTENEDEQEVIKKIKNVLKDSPLALQLQQNIDTSHLHDEATHLSPETSQSIANLSLLQATKQHLQRNQRNPQTQPYDLDKEIQLYLHEPAQTLESDPLLYWKGETRFTKLKKLAARYLAIPAGSVFCKTNQNIADI